MQRSQLRMKKNKRHLARELALQHLFSLEFNTPEEDSFATVEEETSKQADMAFFECLVHGVTTRKEEIDELLQKHIAKRNITRVDKVDMTILRIAIFESTFADKPTDRAIAINEAIELAKEFGADASYKFINGVLDNYHKQLPNTVTP